MQTGPMSEVLTDPRSIATMAAALAAIAAAIAAFISLPFTARAANAAVAQTRLQKEIAEQAMQPTFGWTVNRILSKAVCSSLFSPMKDPLWRET